MTNPNHRPKHVIFTKGRALVVEKTMKDRTVDSRVLWLKEVYLDLPAATFFSSFVNGLEFQLIVSRSGDSPKKGHSKKNSTFTQPTHLPFSSSNLLDGWLSSTEAKGRWIKENSHV